MPLQKVLTPPARIQSESKLNIAARSGLELLNPHFLALTEFKSVYTVLWMMIYFQSQSYFPYRQNTTDLSLLYHYFYGKCSDKLHFILSLVQTFTVRSHHATIHKVVSSSSYSIGKKVVSLRLLFYGTNFQVDAYLITTILTSS